MRKMSAKVNKLGDESFSDTSAAVSTKSRKRKVKKSMTSAIGDFIGRATLNFPAAAETI